MTPPQPARCSRFLLGKTRSPRAWFWCCLDRTRSQWLSPPPPPRSLVSSALHRRRPVGYGLPLDTLEPLISSRLGYALSASTLSKSPNDAQSSVFPLVRVWIWVQRRKGCRGRTGFLEQFGTQSALSGSFLKAVGAFPVRRTRSHFSFSCSVAHFIHLRNALRMVFQSAQLPDSPL